MDTNFELPKNTYTGFASIGGSKRENEVDPIENLESNPEHENPPEHEAIKEDVDHYPLYDSMYHGFGDKPMSAARNLLQDFAHQGHDHRNILDAARHIKEVKAAGADNNLDNIIGTANKLTPEIHEHVRQTLRDNQHDTGLHAKYSWVFNHPDTHVEPPEYNENNAHLQFIDEDHIRQHHKDFQFVGGRTVVDKITGSRHHLNHDGSLSPVGRNYNQTHIEHHPLSGDGSHGEVVKYNHDMLSHHYERQLSDLESHPHSRVLRNYTEDSVPYNKATAKANKGVHLTGDDKMYIGSETHTDAHHLDGMIKSLDPAPLKFKVYAGLSKSTDPMSAGETSQDRKTTHLPAFTSTSLHNVTAQGFSRPKDSEFGKVHDIMEINVPKYHSGGAYIDSHSTNSGEHEYLLTHGHVIEHDAKPKYYVTGSKMHRVWSGGEIKGVNQHPDWKHIENTPDKMTPEVTKQMEGSHIPTVRQQAVFSEHATEKGLIKTLNENPTLDKVRAIVSHNNLGSDALGKVLGKDSHRLYHKIALDNPNYGEDHAIGTLSAHPDLAEHVLSHPNVPRHVALMASSHPSSHLRRGSILSGKLHDSEVTKMIDDPHPEVSKIAKIATGKFEERLNKLVEIASLINA